jgi:hypothetical protein
VIGASLGAAANAALNGIYTPSFAAAANDTRNPFVSQMRAIATKAGLQWNSYTYYGINTAYVLSQALKAAGKNLTRKGLINSLQTNAADFRSGASVPMVINNRSHQGLTGFWMGQFGAKSDLKRLTKYVMVATSSSSGKARQINFTPKPPTKKLLP